MKSIKLPLAYDEANDKYYHISEDIPDGIELVCPYCFNSVSARKGKVRRHHFYHLNFEDIECNVQPETALHEGAKLYLYNKLKEDEKIDFYKEKNISYIEIEPLENGLYDYKFKIKSYGGIELFNNLNNLKEYLYELYEEDILNKYKEEIDQKYNLEMRKDIQNEIIDDIISNLSRGITHNKFYQESNDSLGASLSPFFNTLFEPKTRNKYSKELEVTYEVCNKLDYKHHEKGTNIKFNNRYSLDSQFYMLGAIYKRLSSNGTGVAILNQRYQIVGIKLFVTDPKELEKKEESIILKEEKERGTISILETRGKRGKNDNPYLTMEDCFVKKPVTQLMNVLEFLRSNYKVILRLEKNEYNRRKITKIKVKGLVNEKGIENYILTNYVPELIEGFKI